MPPGGIQHIAILQKIRHWVCQKIRHTQFNRVSGFDNLRGEIIQMDKILPMQLTIVNHKGKYVANSVQVAQMIGKEHKHLLRDIKGYIIILTESNFGLSDFFIPSTYVDSTGRTLPCYLITKKGCELIAHKLTGKKGVQFTAAYVIMFEQMENALMSRPIESYLIEDPIARAERWIQEQKEKQAEAEKARIAEEQNRVLEAENKVLLPNEM